MSNSQIQLTQTVQKGGCAAKVAATELRKILQQVDFPPAPPALMVGAGTFDDAAIYKLNSETALVQTLDFFTPIVNTPLLFGKIAAANALSDVYAMGGRPVTAMAIFAFPLATMESSVAVDVLQGASDVIRDSGAALVGGHTIDDDTMKFGLSVTGLVHPSYVWTNAGARPGDTLILTKPLGTGTLTAALKRGETDEAGISEALSSMCQLNNVIDLLPRELAEQIHAATDVTGFGLAGHALNMSRASDVTLEIHSKDLPVFARTLEFLEKGFLTKAHRTNADYIKDHSHFESESKMGQHLVTDPQTSGGLLLAVAANAAPAVIEKLRTQFPRTQSIGSVRIKEGVSLRFQ